MHTCVSSLLLQLRNKHSQCTSINRNRKNLNKIYDDEGFAFLLYECTCNTKVTRILFNIYQPSNMLYINNITKQRRKYVLRS